MKNKILLLIAVVVIVVSSIMFLGEDLFETYLCKILSFLKIS